MHARKEEIIKRLLSLTPQQFERVIYLYEKMEEKTGQQSPENTQ